VSVGPSAAAAADGAPGHRGDVQALRGLAVLAVVVHHARLPLPGGFLGVDVFFVVSGFVIGRLLHGELAATGRVDLGAFYARRVRRLLPASTLLTVATVAATVWLLSPYGPQQEAFDTALAAQVFGANVQLYRNVGYLEASLPQSEANPFLHMWSLAVEEQFYVVVPVLLAWVWRRGRGAPARRSVAGIAALSAASFALSWGLATDRWTFGLEAPQRLAFYGLPTRAWELGLGLLTALVADRGAAAGPAGAGAARRARWAPTVAVLGVILVVGAFLEVRPDMAHPGLGAAGAALGTAALLAAGSWSSSLAGRLAWRPFVLLGDRSYAWYLWHWPAIVLAAVVWPTSPAVRPLAAAAALVPAAASTRWVERPLRASTTIVGRRAVLLGLACLVVGTTAVGLGRWAARDRLGVPLPAAWDDYPFGGGTECHLVNRDAVDRWDPVACGPTASGVTARTGAPAGRLVLLLGDSAAYGLAPVVVATAEAAGDRTARWSRAGCPFATRAPARADWCADWQDRAWDLVERLDPDVVVIANQATDYLDPPWGRAPVVGEDGAVPEDEAGRAAAWADTVEATVARLRGAGRAVVLVDPLPAAGAAFVAESPRVPRPDPPVLDRVEVERAGGPARAVARRLATDDHVAVVDPLRGLCDDRRCPGAGPDGRWWYWAAASLTGTGADRLAPEMAEALDAVGG